MPDNLLTNNNLPLILAILSPFFVAIINAFVNLRLKTMDYNHEVDKAKRAFILRIYDNYLSETSSAIFNEQAQFRLSVSYAEAYGLMLAYAPIADIQLLKDCHAALHKRDHESAKAHFELIARSFHPTIQELSKG